MRKCRQRIFVPFDLFMLYYWGEYVVVFYVGLKWGEGFEIYHDNFLDIFACQYGHVRWWIHDRIQL